MKILNPSLALSLLIAIALTTTASAEVLFGERAHDNQREVTFLYSASDSVGSVTLAGSFNNWDQLAEPMTDPDGDGVFEARLVLAIGSSHEYKFVVDGTEWVVDEDNPNLTGTFGNSLLTVPDIDAPPPPATPEGMGALRIQYQHTDAEQVSVIWGINGWETPGSEHLPPDSVPLGDAFESPMTRVDDHEFTITLFASPESVIDFVLHITDPREEWENNRGESDDYHIPVSEETQVFIFRHRGDPLVVMAGHSRYFYLSLTVVIGLGIVIGLTLFAKSSHPRLTRWATALWIGLFVFAIRNAELRRASLDLDERDYVPVSQRFAHGFETGDWAGIIDESAISEHPRLGFSLFAAAIHITGTANNTDAAILSARLVSAIAAALCGFIIALRFPLAGVLWALFGISLHYTSVAYLDGPMTLFSTACVLAFDAAVRQSNAAKRTVTMWPWLMASAVCAGFTVSSKYLGAVAPIAVAFGFAALIATAPPKKRRRVSALFGAYVAIALLAMIASDCHLWTSDFLNRIVGRLQFHHGFSTSGIVTESGFPWYQPIAWLWNYTAQTEVIGWPWLDRIITVLGVLGFLVMWKREPRIATAFAVTLVFLFLWPTKWPQYEVIFLPWLCIAAQVALEFPIRAIRSLIKKEPGPQTELSQSG